VEEHHPHKAIFPSLFSRKTFPPMLLGKKGYNIEWRGGVFPEKYYALA
jgi:hypothetical protein